MAAEHCCRCQNVQHKKIDARPVLASRSYVANPLTMCFCNVMMKMLFCYCRMHGREENEWPDRAAGAKENEND